MRIFNAPLIGNFVATTPFLLQGERLVLDFFIEVQAPSPADIQWFLEFTSSDPNNVDTKWFQESIEHEEGFSGIWDVFPMVRVFRQTDGNLLLLGSHTFSVQAKNRVPHQIARVQIRTNGGFAEVQIDTPLGIPAISPVGS